MVTTDRLRILDADGHAPAAWDVSALAALKMVDMLNIFHEASPEDPDKAMADHRSEYERIAAILMAIDWPPGTGPREGE